MEATISIKGMIGTFPDPNTGKDIVGMQLGDLATQLHSAISSGATSLRLEIDSPGGDKDLGFEFFALLKATKLPIHAVIVGECYSIASAILLAGDTRELGPGGIPPMIHMPWFTNISGGSEYLALASEVLKVDEDELINFYHQHTGVEKVLLASLMKVETYMTKEQAFDFKFLTVQPATLKAVAFKKSDDMTGKQALEALRLQLGLGKSIALALILTDDAGVDIETNSQGDVPQVGDTAMIAGAPAPDGTYPITAQAISIVVVGGVITEVNALDISVDAEVVALKAENETLKSKEVILNARIAELEAIDKEKDTILVAVAARMTVNKDVKIPGRDTAFNKAGDSKKTVSVTVADLAAERAKRKAKV